MIRAILSSLQRETNQTFAAYKSIIYMHLPTPRPRPDPAYEVVIAKKLVVIPSLKIPWHNDHWQPWDIFAQEAKRVAGH